ncbi:hypothetical protein EDB89DRAFT_1907817 [Lactarius sanguifluus]|nr:hypothetical protein EDB89DRAFT_1907817 [Lactarius sanguifluus]
MTAVTTVVRPRPPLGGNGDDGRDHVEPHVSEGKLAVSAHDSHIYVCAQSLPFKTSVPMVCHKYVVTLSSFGLRYIRAKHVSMRSGVQFGMTLGDGRRRGHRRAVRNTVHGCFGGEPRYFNDDASPKRCGYLGRAQPRVMV